VGSNRPCQDIAVARFPRLDSTRWTLQDQLYNGKANAVDHVADRMNFIAMGIVELAKPRGNLDIGIVAKAAGRIQAAARHIGVAGGEILDSR
jgi:hypothetical protein